LLCLLGIFFRRGDRLVAGVDLVVRIIDVFTIAVRRWFAAVAAPTSHRTPTRPCERTGDGPSSPTGILFPETAGIVLVILIADFVAPLIARTLPLAAVFNASRAILSQVLPRGSGSTGVAPRTARGCGTAG